MQKQADVVGNHLHLVTRPCSYLSPQFVFSSFAVLACCTEVGLQKLNHTDYSLLSSVKAWDFAFTWQMLQYCPQQDFVLDWKFYIAGLLDSCNNAWNEHASDLDEAIEAWDPEGEDPEVTKFREWLSGICSETDMDPTLLTDPRPEFRALRYECSQLFLTSSSGFHCFVSFSAYHL